MRMLFKLVNVCFNNGEQAIQQPQAVDRVLAHTLEQQPHAQARRGT